MRIDTAVSLVLLARLSGRVGALVERLDQTTGKEIRERLEDWLRARSALAGQGPFALGLTQTALAEELGTVREVVVRALRGLVDDGVVTRVGRGTFRLARRSAAAQAE